MKIKQLKWKKDQNLGYDADIAIGTYSVLIYTNKKIKVSFTYKGLEECTRWIQTVGSFEEGKLAATQHYREILNQMLEKE